MWSRSGLALVLVILAVGWWGGADAAAARFHAALKYPPQRVGTDIGDLNRGQGARPCGPSPKGMVFARACVCVMGYGGVDLAT